MDKIAFVDVDGTLTMGKSSWERVHEFFDVVPEMAEHSMRFFSGEITYDEWASLDVGLWKGRPIGDLDQALNPPELIKGASDGIKLLKAAGYHVILLSGGIDVMVNEVARLVGADEAFANKIGETNGIIDGTVTVKVNVKSDVITELAEQRKIDLDQALAIGDAFNDIDMFKLVGKSLAINSSDKQLKEVATISLETDNFVEAVRTILDLRSER